MDRSEKRGYFRVDHRVMNYGIFAQVYNELMDDAVFLDWRDYVSNHLPNGTAILELGCGNGQLGILLKDAGYSIEGLDLSEEMLSLAKVRQEEAGIHFPLIQADMRNLTDFGTYEAIISFCDSLCYLPEKSDLEQTFEQVYAHLEEEGVFLFDVFTTEHIADLDGYSYHDELPGIVFMWDSFKGEHTDSIEHDLSFFIEQADGSYKREMELHKERTYSIETYQELLKAAGFTNIEISADFDQEITGNNTRWFFKARK